MSKLSVLSSTFCEYKFKYGKYTVSYVFYNVSDHKYLFMVNDDLRKLW